MFVHGNGSVNSPIVISDEEDAAYVEQELSGFGARLTDPEPPFQPPTSDISMYNWNTPPIPYSSNMQAYGNNDGMQGPAPVAGQKRKRNHAVPPVEAPHFVHESKNQRKKRRRAERLAAEQTRVQDSRLVEISPSSPVASRTRPEVAPLPDRPVIFHDIQQSGILPPVSWSASFTTHTAVIPPPLSSSLPPKPPPLATSVTHFPSYNTFSQFPAPPSLSQLPERRQQPPHIPLPPPPTIPVAPSHPLPRAPDDTGAEQAPLAQKKILGMPRESDKGRQGIFPTEALRQPLPDPTRTLVLAPIPKKFRNHEFVKHWARKFVRPQPSRIEVDKMQGKALVEFQSVEYAEKAHGSMRLAGEGKEHIRAWWYRGPAKNQSDLEEGEIEEGVVEEPLPLPQPTKKKQNKSQKKAEKKKAQVVAQFQRPQQGASMPHTMINTAFNATSSGRPFTASVPIPLLQPALPPPPGVPLSNAPLPIPSSSRTVNAPVATRRSPNPYAYHSRADLTERANKYGFVDAESELDDGYAAPAESVTRGYYGTSSRFSRVYQEEEQAMDLESDEERSVREEKYSPGSRYLALAETIQVVNNGRADSASIASSRAGSVEQAPASQMCVDDDASSSSPPSGVAPSNKAAQSESSSLSPAKPPSKAFSPSVFTMMEPPTARVTAAASHVSAAGKGSEPAHSSVESDIPLGKDGTKASAGSTVRSQDAPRMTPSLLPAATNTPTPSLPHGSSTPQSAARADSSTPVVHTKRTLLEKQRELEERIARAKAELARKSAVPRASTSRHASPDEDSSKSAPSVGAGNAAIHSAESELRRSALQSRKKAGVSPTESLQQTNNVSAVDSRSGEGVSPPAAAAMTSAIDFDDLAVSFINETLQTVRPSPPADPSSAATSFSSQSIPSTAPTTPQLLSATPSFLPIRPTQVTEKSMLAAKQKRLEQHLADTKILMTKLGAARTKVEKDSILSTLRERQRAYDDEMKNDGFYKPAPPALPSLHAAHGYSNHHQSQIAQAWKTQWPEPSSDAMILIISDDEDDED